jgi:hypothetical protein
MSIVSATLLCAGGAVLLLSLPIDAATGYGTSMTLEGAGLALAFAGTLFGRGFYQRDRGWVMLVLGTGTWIVCWSWPLFFGFIVPIPLAVWPFVAAALLLIGSGFALEDSEYANASVGGVMAVGSFVTLGIMLANPVFSPIHTFMPLAVSAIAAASIWFLVPVSEPSTPG